LSFGPTLRLVPVAPIPPWPWPRGKKSKGSAPSAFCADRKHDTRRNCRRRVALSCRTALPSELARMGRSQRLHPLWTAETRMHVPVDYLDAQSQLQFRGCDEKPFPSFYAASPAIIWTFFFFFLNEGGLSKLGKTQAYKSKGIQVYRHKGTPAYEHTSLEAYRHIGIPAYQHISTQV
jgi:hypothetical protein